jgi:hypothetical protein
MTTTPFGQSWQLLVPILAGVTEALGEQVIGRLSLVSVVDRMDEAGFRKNGTPAKMFPSAVKRPPAPYRRCRVRAGGYKYSACCLIGCQKSSGSQAC